MKHQDYCCDDSTRQAYEQYYRSQAGNGLPGFQGLQYQRSHGLGSLFRGLVGVAAPLLKKGAIVLGKSLGQKALKAGAELAQDYLGDNKRNSNQRKHVISSRAVKRRGPPRKKTKRYILLNMPLIHPLSCECVKSELDLFAVPLTQTSVEEGRWVEYGPITAVRDSDETIEFKIAKTDSST